MRKLASLRKINSLTPIDGADRIELAKVDGWQSVVKKDEFKVGDVVIYFEIDSFLPILPQYEFLRRSCLATMDGEEGFRLRSVRLRGSLSQGLIMPAGSLAAEYNVGDDLTEALSVRKYEKPIAACLSDKALGQFPSDIPKTDEERIQNLEAIYDSFLLREFTVTEKLDGTSCTFFVRNGEFGICSRNLLMDPNGDTTYAKVAAEIGIENMLRSYYDGLVVQGEIVGPGIQGNKYGLKKHTFYVFNMLHKSRFYFHQEDVELFARKHDLHQVPIVARGQVPLDSVERMIEFADGQSAIGNCPREGLVWAAGEGDAERVSFKVISNNFLLQEK